MRPALSAIPALSLALSLILSFAGPVLAQTYEVVGLIVDAQRGEPLAGVEIRTPEGQKLGVSQSTGRFEVTVNNRRARLLFSRQGFRTAEVDLGDLPHLIDVEINLESAVQELAEVTTYAPRRGQDPSQAHSIEELELMQGMRMDLNDHLRQMHGVAGMNEFTGDISVHGSRTRDVTHYLGKSRIPSLRHLEFGFPGNQSVLNPRLLKSVTLADNPAKGPLNQGNASALVYDLKEGDPEAIRGDVVLGTVNRELNLTGYWNERTFLTSFRYLDPNSLGALGRQFFTTPKDSRLPGNGTPCDSTRSCKGLDQPFDFVSGDMFLGTFKRDTTGAFSRHSLVVLGDDYEVLEDMGRTSGEAVAQTLVEGFQGAWMYSYEKVLPGASGDWEWGLSVLRRDFADSYHDTLAPRLRIEEPRLWYGTDAGRVDYLLGKGGRLDWQGILSGQWSPSGKVWGAQAGYGLELEYLTQERDFEDLPTGQQAVKLSRDMLQGHALFRLRWTLREKRGVEASLGASGVYDAPLEGEDGGEIIPGPLASVRYIHPLGDRNKVYAEVAGRHSATFEPEGYNRLGVQATPSAEAKVGGDGMLADPIRYAWSLYGRGYLDPSLPDPDVYWNYEETRRAEFAYVRGGNATVSWLPSHHFGIGVNASVIQGEYALEDGDYLPWESNRLLDLVANMRVVPRSDSLFSLILTYGAQNGAPLYEYAGLWEGEPSTGRATGRRSVRQSERFPEVSRQRLDARVNLDLKSRWRPLESVRFFFEADNIFNNFDDSWAAWLGGRNERRRGWTRANSNGDLQPLVTRGLGLFILFGVEGKLKI